MRDIRILSFQVRQFVRTSYFTQVLIISTLTALLLQWLLLNALGETANARELAWLRAGFIGSWSVSCVAAGILGFQRYQSTLPHLVFARVGVVRALFPVIISCVVYGLLAFPLAALGGLLLGFPVTISSFSHAILGLLMHFCGSAVVAVCIALFFLLTPNAITYEPLLTLPVLLLVGVFGYPPAVAPVLETVAGLVPLAFPFQVLEQSVLPDSANWLPGAALLWAFSMGIWIALLAVSMRVVLKKVVAEGTLELV